MEDWSQKGPLLFFAGPNYTLFFRFSTLCTVSTGGSVNHDGHSQRWGKCCRFFLPMEFGSTNDRRQRCLQKNSVCKKRNNRTRRFYYSRVYGNWSSQFHGEYDAIFNDSVNEGKASPTCAHILNKFLIQRENKRFYQKFRQALSFWFSSHRLVFQEFQIFTLQWLHCFYLVFGNKCF